MNNGQRFNLENGVLTKMNRIHKLSKIAKAEFKNSNDETLPNQEKEIADSRFTSMVEQMEQLVKEIKSDYNKLITTNKTYRAMEIETTEDLAEKIADWLGIYGGCKDDKNEGCAYDKSKPFCCRVGFVGAIKERMIEAIENDKKLSSNIAIPEPQLPLGKGKEECSHNDTRLQSIRCNVCHDCGEIIEIDV